MAFVECSGNTAPMFSNEPVQATAQALHGLVSNAEWTGVPLSILLDEAGIDPNAKWLIAEGADARALDRSVPLKKASTTRWLRSTRTASASCRATAIRCGSCCPATRAT